ncbi:hypothetical protein L211DRAFT_122628 [Terfezia boudieri ATCC MYA-4762]|uniref:Uncharacterized protein n=1 Tax=Terfezia boudieri ATCC MYA-4762 TaxID=1051890 RepID=A0A3N4LXK5_9PEZI|nr:hypothetical protein L211DRAFT_122628 [Terfezia boudieri ATCC MYA-4762]
MYIFLWATLFRNPSFRSSLWSLRNWATSRGFVVQDIFYLRITQGLSGPINQINVETRTPSVAACLLTRTRVSRWWNEGIRRQAVLLQGTYVIAPPTQCEHFLTLQMSIVSHGNVTDKKPRPEADIRSLLSFSPYPGEGEKVFLNVLSRPLRFFNSSKGFSESRRRQSVCFACCANPELACSVFVEGPESSNFY